ncbi:class I SAM-dependent methyltransferase [Natronococcus wangiae]|uniref:class I SAM-dependent methyltransferase n=1 Tax=Natronococcus wangiae TaxID=3068275 RepID=UPI00273F8640|nr:class I SAM-dependent methyltransferase [Natronococcus sp. AD5]
MFDKQYYFGIYHWRRRFRLIATATFVLAVAIYFGSRTKLRRRRIASATVSLVAAVYEGRSLLRLVSPPPWCLERYKYDALAARLPLDRANRVLDVGCGTGRSLVGVAPHIPNGSDGPDVIAVDVFDDRIILGNGPRLARRNAGRAGLAVEPVVGDAAKLPLRDGAADVVTACRVLHDLPTPAVDEALRELRRVCASDGTLGVLALPILPDGVETDYDADLDPESYWVERVSDAAFAVEAVERLERGDGTEPYVIIVAAPSASSTPLLD